MRKLLVSVAVLGLVGGCSDTGADHDGDGKITAEEVAKEMNQVTLEPGEWENTVEIVDVEIEGLPEGVPAGIMDRMKGQTTTTKSCITKEEAENPGAQFFAAQEKTNCEVKKFDMSGGAVSSEMSCSNMGGTPGEMTMEMDGQYGPSSYDMTMNMVGGGGGMKMNISARSNGKRIGSCPTG
ncbi:DUF3617 domain-containing protein [Sphingorhabdus sp. 109]|uniref:DUF3617 domain-containing protein n=1 Tax=Sphingorhabdus sp. 109 TaxID=2653173 RepID=UPI0012F0D0D6|nr:DUF3617 domain-containing protein [Sphingorhabdus sp. 109]VWX59064.1 conserved hypothetical protein [Sphingorhabdus sp. 109]